MMHMTQISLLFKIQKSPIIKTSVLTVGDFFDTLKNRCEETHTDFVVVFNPKEQSAWE